MTFVLEAADELRGEETVQGHRAPIENVPLTPSSASDGQREVVPERMVEGGPSILDHSPEHRPGQAFASSPLPASLDDTPPLLSLREASLMRSFIEKIAPWVSSRGGPFHAANESSV